MDISQTQTLCAEHFTPEQPLPCAQANVGTENVWRAGGSMLLQLCITACAKPPTRATPTLAGVAFDSELQLV